MSRLDASQITSQESDQTTTSNGGSDFLTNLEGIIQQVENSPQLQQIIGMAMQSQGIDPQGDSNTVMDNNSEQQAVESADNDADLLGLVKALENQVGGDFTIAQIRMYMEQNPEHVEQLADEYL